MKQTAVEWFFKWFNDNPEATHKEYAEAFEQAKAMEKEQMIDCYLKADVFPRKYEFEEYYKETFKSE